MKFWDSITLDRGTDEVELLGTVTAESEVVRLRDRLERRLLRRVLPLRGDERVLDLGGGAGRIAFALAPRVSSVTCVDASVALVEAGRRAGAQRGLENVSFVLSDALEYLAHTSESFDVVVVFNLFTHLDARQADELARGLHRVLAPGGRLVIKEPVTSDGTERVDERSHYRATFRPADTYARIVGSARFRLIHQQPTVAHPIPWFLGGTEQVARASGSTLASALLRHVTPVWVRLDPWVGRLEQAMRADPRAARLLAPLPVLQHLYVFERVEPDVEIDLSVVVIAYDEEECITAVVEELSRELDRSLADTRYELVLVDDGSRDATADRMRELERRSSRINLVLLPKNRGIGGALRAGFDAARGAYVTWVPADGQIPPSVVCDLYRARRRAPMVTTVYVNRADGFHRDAMSATLNAIIRARSGEPAKSGGNYLFERSLWTRHAPRDDDTMMLSTAFRQALRANDVEIAELAIEPRRRVAGRSKVLDPKTLARTFLAAMRMSRRPNAR